jgi:beta-aspartyl-peptidase (threonine type)
MPQPPEPAIIVHGGAGDPPTSDEETALAGARRAAERGLEILKGGGSALDAVEAAVLILEDDPAFNAGTGASLNAAGEVELDASVMDGSTLGCGAVASVRDVKNPITLARAVMEKSPHVLLGGAGASAFARQMGIAAYDNARLITDRRRALWEQARAGASATRTGTVGAVARDRNGHLAAATSTGGRAMKLPGRIGDTPLPGCGNYADDRLGAVSCTGLGERIIQVTLARHCADLVGRGLSAADAARQAVAYLDERVGGECGLIVIGPRGEPGFANNTPAMTRAYSSARGIVAER